MWECTYRAVDTIPDCKTPVCICIPPLNKTTEDTD